MTQPGPGFATSVGDLDKIANTTLPQVAAALRPPVAVFGTVRRATGLALAATLLSGCTGGDPAPPSRTSPPRTSAPAPVPADSGLRPVRITYGDGIGYVPWETSAQALCQALTPQQWREALGGEVGRRIQSDELGSTCVVDSETLGLTLSMGNKSSNDLSYTDTVGGRPAAMAVQKGSASAVVAVLPAAATDAKPHPLLFAALTPRTDVRPDLDTTIRRILGSLVPKLTTDGPPTPVPGADGFVPYVPTEPVAGVPLPDLPRPVQGLVLCTALARAFHGAADPGHVVIGDDGGCTLSNPKSHRLTSARIRQVPDAVPPGQPALAGHPAHVVDDRITVELRMLPAEDGAPHVVLEVREAAAGEKLRGLAEKLLPVTG
ncbi:hypothetical protein [Actinophytocola sp.]|uniref:hypothetical protein n=1 Tax=Actinophytocola sp. TaxID=1872138 RepID=UPI002ED869AD